jgi:hypothetical protein
MPNNWNSWLKKSSKAYSNRKTPCYAVDGKSSNLPRRKILKSTANVQDLSPMKEKQLLPVRNAEISWASDSEMGAGDDLLDPELDF